MAIRITDECINCGACEPECPNNAIYEGGALWSMSEGTSLSDDSQKDPVADEFYFIVTDKCTECKGFHDQPQCASVCPVDCCIPDLENVETESALLEKKAHLHKES